MITSATWAGKRYGVLGLARSGAATVRALLASGADVVAWDADEGRREALDHPGEGRDQASGGAHLGPGLRRGGLEVADLDGVDLATLDALVFSPGVPLNTHPLAAKARAAGVPIVGDIELFAQARSGLPPHRVVGITGTNGKSTTTALVHHILQTAGVPSLMGGNIGLPILAQEPLPDGGVYVLELSSYQIDLTHSLDCHVAVLTNITPDHLDRYDGFEAYKASKLRIFEMMNAPHIGIFHQGANDRGMYEKLRDANDWRIWSNYDDNVSDPYDLWGAFNKGGQTGSRDHLSTQLDWPALQGPHNGRNAIAAILACSALDIPEDKVSDALRTFPGLPHRTQRIGEVKGIAFVDDSKATNPESTAPALAAYPRVHWIVGGRAKGDDLEACRPGFPRVARAYTIGEAGPRFAAWLREAGVQVSECGTLEVAVNAAFSAALPGETVLLSPAAASFDQFRDYEHRGAEFKHFVEALA